MPLLDAVMEQTLVYRAWQAPFSNDKFAPVVANNDLQATRRVLDVGCGPGTNTHHFADADYLGVDINPSYIRSARRRHQREFLVRDIREYEVDPDERFDFVLINSFLHHVDAEHVDRILSRVSALLTDDGHVHVIELLLPAERSVAQRLALWDRGDYPRPLTVWEQMFAKHFETVAVEPFTLTAAGVTLWRMAYLKGRPRPLVESGA